MPDFHFEYDSASRVLAVRVTGAFTDTIMRALYDAASGEIERREVRAAFLDLTDAREFNLSAEAVRQVSRLAPLIPDPMPKYIVAAEDHIYGMARMFQITSSGRDSLQIVRTANDVYTALGLTAPSFERLA